MFTKQCVAVDVLTHVSFKGSEGAIDTLRGSFDVDSFCSTLVWILVKWGLPVSLYGVPCSVYMEFMCRKLPGKMSCASL